MKKALYIHIPFCRKKCLYCDFYSTNYSASMSHGYVDLLCNQIEQIKSKISTIYIGGGTPTVISSSDLKRLFLSLNKISFGVSEFTIEANPESLTENKIKLFLDSGVNRISIGVQSVYDNKLKKLGRIHSFKKAKDAIALSKKLGFKNISVDLIFGVWGQTLDNWRKELEKIVKLPITHLSCYALTCEENTKLFKNIVQGECELLDEETVSEMYKLTQDVLAKSGFAQYEVSSFAKDGFECKHNLNYWQGNDYIGLGPSAASYQNGVRSGNVRDITEYIKLLRSGGSLVEFSEELPLHQRAREYAAIKIRTKKGIDFGEFKQRFGINFEKLEKNSLETLKKQGLIRYKKDKNGVFLSKKGFLFCDTVSCELI